MAQREEILSQREDIAGRLRKSAKYSKITSALVSVIGAFFALSHPPENNVSSLHLLGASIGIFKLGTAVSDDYRRNADSVINSSDTEFISKFKYDSF